LYAIVTRSKLLPFGGELSDRDILEIGDRLKKAIDNAQSIGRVTMTAAAKIHWAAVYGPLSRDRDGLLGAVTARAEAQVVRLALVYALLDSKPEIDENHVAAALAVWEYCEASAAYIFSELLGDPVADEIFHALQQAESHGMTRTAIRDLFGRHQSSDRIGAALRLLATTGRARMTQDQTKGRPLETWFAVVR
jgi:DNA replicative helicase MCM subunit Mcm2 (Cdc46/Mcm family)